MAMDFPASPTMGQTFTSTNGQTYTWLGTAWRVLVPGSQMSRTVFTATSGQTTFSMNYTPGFIDVFLNGVKLVNGSDFTATSATTIVLANACNVGDTLEVLSLAQVAYTDAAKAEDVFSVVRGFKNRIINGDMRVFQRGVAVTTDSTYSVDRWRFGKSNDASESVTQSTDAPPGFTHSIKNTVSVGDASIGAAQYSNFKHAIEGVNISDLAFGTAAAKPVTLSFWVKSSVSGLYSGNICNYAETRICPFTFTINVANTWEYKTYTFTGDTGGTWAIDTGGGLSIYIYMALGSNFYNGTAGTWGAPLNYGAGGASHANAIATAGNTFAITGVQLEVGTVTNPVFERRSYQQELAMCQRYYLISRGYTGLQNGEISGTIYFPVQMRATPTIVQTYLAGLAGALTGTDISQNECQWWKSNSTSNFYRWQMVASAEL